MCDFLGNLKVKKYWDYLAETDRQSQNFYFRIGLITFLALVFLLLLKFTRIILIRREDDGIIDLLSQLFALHVPYLSLFTLFVEAVRTDQQEYHYQQDGNEGEEQHTGHEILIDLEDCSDVGEGTRVVVIVQRNVFGLRGFAAFHIREDFYCLFL